jgi:cob(I)alamin adenosyltransferase
MEKGYVHLYTGNGKGKTTAAFGLAVRAAMAGKKVYIGQFVKDMVYNETKIQETVPNIEVEQLGEGCFIEKPPTESDRKAARLALVKCGELMRSGAYQMVILDEITIALYFKLLTVEEVVKVLKGRNPEVEIVLTGRYAPQELIDIADLVTEMKEIKHYYATEGVLSRDGIDR